MSGRILITDDDRDLCELIEADLGRRGFSPASAASAEEAMAVLKTAPFDVVLTDLNMPGIGGIELCSLIAERWPDVPVVVITAFGSMEAAVAALRAGAYDFVTKPIDLELLALILDRAIRHHDLQGRVKTLSEEVERSQRFDELLGASPPMQELYARLARVADSEASVLVSGESGTGKELVARSLHRKSRRSAGPFVAINCAALPDTLLDSELFGHTKGAFTDARFERKGLFLQADGGTLFLDEVDAFPLVLQAKLLRALEERVLRPVGSDTEVPFDTRLVSGTSLDLESCVEEGRFRRDLFFRINVITVELPPLRSRGTDVLLLAQFFVEQFAARPGKKVTGLSKAVAEKLLAYSWPGNVRELRNAMERAVALTDYERVEVEDLPERIRKFRGSDLIVAGDDPAGLLPLDAVERRYIQHVLTSVGGNRTRAARILGLDRKTLYRKLKDFASRGDEQSR